MKTLYRISFAFFLFSTLFIACNPDDDDDTPVTGDVIDKLEGTWLVDENEMAIGKDSYQYHVYIDKDPNDSTRILIGNFYQLGNQYDCYATVNKTNYTIDITPQTISGGYYVEGNGTINATCKSINLNYTVDPGDTKMQVTSMYTKQ